MCFQSTEPIDYTQLYPTELQNLRSAYANISTNEAGQPTVGYKGPTIAATDPMWNAGASMLMGLGGYGSYQQSPYVMGVQQGFQDPNVTKYGQMRQKMSSSTPTSNMSVGSPTASDGSSGGYGSYGGGNYGGGNNFDYSVFNQPASDQSYYGAQDPYSNYGQPTSPYGQSQMYGQQDPYGYQSQMQYNPYSSYGGGYNAYNPYQQMSSYAQNPYMMYGQQQYPQQSQYQPTGTFTPQRQSFY